MAEIIPVGGTLVLPDGDVPLTQPIVIRNQEKINVVGGLRTRLLWQGGPTNGVIQYVGVRKGFIGGDGRAGFEIVCQSSGANAGVLIANSDVTGGFISTGIQVNNVHIRHAGSQQAFEKGFSVDSHICDPAGVHGFNNNESHRFVNCSVESCLKAAFHVRGHQCYDIAFQDCNGLDAGRVVNGASVSNRIYGVWVESGASVILKNCVFTRCGIDVFMGQPCLRCTFEGHNSEHGRILVGNNKRNLDTGEWIAAATSSDYYVHGRDIRWNGEPFPDVPVVDMCGRGPITFTNSFFMGINGVCPYMETIQYAKIVNGAQVRYKGRLNVEDTTIGQHGGTIPTLPIIRTPTTWSPRVSQVEHKYIESDGTQNWRPVSANTPLPATPDN